MKTYALRPGRRVWRGTAAGLGEDAEASLWMLCNICSPACEVEIAVARSTTSLSWRRAYSSSLDVAKEAKANGPEMRQKAGSSRF